MIEVVDFLLGLGIGSYRSFYGPGSQLLAPLSRVNLIAGQNNAGKSNLLRFAAFLGDRHAPPPLTPLDRPFGVAPAEPLRAALAIPLSDADVAERFASQGGRGIGNVRQLVEALRAPSFRLTDDDLFWVK